MVAQAADELADLAGFCEDEAEELDSVKDWSVEMWDLSDGAKAALLACYNALLAGDPTPEVEARLEGDGLLLNDLLLAEDEASPTITRADMCELAAAATLLALDGIDIVTLHMPNVPKGERSGSAPGIDAMAAYLDEDGEASSFSEDEFIVMCSAKHTIANVGDLRRKVVSSLDEDEALTMPYVAGQLRVLEGRLAERGIDARRVYLALSDFPDPEFVRLVGVGVVPLDLQSQQVAGLRHLPIDTSACRHFRCLAVADLGRLHEEVA